MSAEQLIAEFKALSGAERQHVARAILSDEMSRLPLRTVVPNETTHGATAKPTFSERWSGRFTLPEPDPEDAKLSYLLQRFSA